MKVKNIMFSGAMASILMIGGAYAADLDPTALTTVSFVKGGVTHAIDTAESYTNTVIAGLDATASQTAGDDGLALSITEENGKITAISGSIAANKYDSYGAATTAANNALDSAKAIIGGEYSAGEGKTVADAISALQSAVGTGETALGTRVTNLESAVNSETSGLATKASQSDLNALKGLVGTTAVTDQISTAVAAEAGRADGAYDAKGAAASAAAAVQGSTDETVASVDAKVAAINAEGTGILAQAQGYADGLASNYDAAGAAKAVQGDTSKTVASVVADIADLQEAIAEKQGTLTGSTYIDISEEGTVSVKNIADTWSN